MTSPRMLLLLLLSCISCSLSTPQLEFTTSAVNFTAPLTLERDPAPASTEEKAPAPASPLDQVPAAAAGVHQAATDCSCQEEEQEHTISSSNVRIVSRPANYCNPITCCRQRLQEAQEQKKELAQEIVNIKVVVKQLKKIIGQLKTEHVYVS